MIRSIFVILSVLFVFNSSVQAQGLFRGRLFRGYGNGYYQNYYQRRPQIQRQVTQTKQEQVQPKEESTTEQTSQEQKVDYPYVYNPGNVELTEAEKYIINEVNKFRVRYGRAPFVVSPGLMNSARAQTRMMGSYGMQHGLVSRPFGSSENIAPTSSPSYAVDMWIKSSPHFSNMLGGSHRFIGVGCFGGYATQQFSGYSDVKYSLVNPEDKKEEVKEESKTSNDITDAKEEVKDQDQSQDQETKVETSSDEVSVQETNAIKEDSSKITEEVKEEVSKKNSSENENKNTDTDSDVNSDDQKKNKKLGFFEPKPLPEGAYIEKVPVKGGVPGEYLPVLRYR